MDRRAFLLGVTATACAGTRNELIAKGPAANHGSRSSGTAHHYGFRADPMRFLETGDNLEAALLRTRVFHTPKPDDSAIIAKRVDQVLSKMRPDGTFEEGDSEHNFRRAALSGLERSDPRAQTIFDAIVRQCAAKPEGALVGPTGLEAACRIGMTDHPLVERSLRHLVDDPTDWLEHTCPWGATFAVKALWYGRDLLPTEAAIDQALTWIGREMNGVGCVRYWDPFAVTGAVGVVETPRARELLVRQLPMILRGQSSDGSWGDNPEDQVSFDVIVALKTHGLLEALAQRPALPPDWRVVRSIPAPEGRLGNLVSSNNALWLLEREHSQLYALSPKDGSILRQHQVPDTEITGLGLWDGALGLVCAKPHKKLLRMEPERGTITRELDIEFVEWPQSMAEVDGQLWVADGWRFPGFRMNGDAAAASDHADLREICGPCPTAFAVTPRGVWHTDHFARAMILTGRGGTLVDWAERPFGWTPGIAWDGEQLWAVEEGKRRIAVIERSSTA